MGEKDELLYPITHPHVVTDGVSPKAILATLAPVLLALLAAAVQWISTGTFDAAELATALVGLGGGVAAGAGAYHGHPGAVQHVDPGPASDALLPAEVHDKIAVDRPG